MTFQDITELPGNLAGQEQQSMLSTRYGLAADYSAGRRVLEVACGAAMGSALLAAAASHYVAADVDFAILTVTASSVSAADLTRTSLVANDATRLPYADASFDTVLMFEAIYYLDTPEAFAREAARVLDTDGTLIVCTVNPEWKGFNPSAHSVEYLTMSELLSTAAAAGFEAHGLIGFLDDEPGLRAKVMRALKRIAVRLHLIPTSMRGKELLKRLVFGDTARLPTLIGPGFAPVEQLSEYEAGADLSNHKVLYVIGENS